MISQGPVNKKITEVILSRNFNITDFVCLRKFPNLSRLLIHDCPQITDSTIFFDESNKIDIIEFHNCSVTLKLFTFIYLYNFKEIIITGDFETKENETVLLVKNAQWKNISNSTVEKIVINDSNISIDVIDYLLISFTNVKFFIISPMVYENVNKYASSGINNQDVIFIDVTNISNCFSLKRDIKFIGLNKNSMQSPYSEAFLEKMKQKHSPIEFEKHFGKILKIMN
jgi:hypothetical protein